MRVGNACETAGWFILAYSGLFWLILTYSGLFVDTDHASGSEAMTRYDTEL